MSNQIQLFVRGERRTIRSAGVANDIIRLLNSLSSMVGSPQGMVTVIRSEENTVIDLSETKQRIDQLAVQVAMLAAMPPVVIDPNILALIQNRVTEIERRISQPITIPVFIPCSDSQQMSGTTKVQFP